MSDTQNGQPATNTRTTSLEARTPDTREPARPPSPAEPGPASASAVSPTGGSAPPTALSGATTPAPLTDGPAQATDPKNNGRATADPNSAKDDEFRKLVIQLGDLSGDLSDKALAARINLLVNAVDLPGRRDRAEYRTAVAYAVQDAERENLQMRMPGGLRAEMGQLSVTYPGLQNERMRELVASTPTIEDKGVIKAIRATAAEIASQPDQQTASVASRVDALANRVRLGADAAETTQTTQRREASSTTTASESSAVRGGQPEVGVGASVQGRPGRVMSEIMTALRRNEREPPAPWDRQLTPMGDRITAFNERMQAGADEAEMRRAERSGTAALTAMKNFTDGPGAVLMTRIRDAAKADPQGMTGVLAEMRDGGRYAGLRQDFNVALQQEKFAASYERAAGAVTTFGADRAEVDKIAAHRPDAAGIAGRFQKLDVEIGKAASELPSRTEGKSFTDELAERAREIVSKAVDVVANAFNRMHAGSSPSPNP